MRKIGKGNIKAQRHRRRHNNKDVKRYDQPFDLIDDNITYQPYGYCRYYRGYLTRNMSILHKCEEKKCQNFELFDEDKITK